MKTILDSKSIEKTLDTMAGHICRVWDETSKNRGRFIDLALVGIRSRGGPIADRLAVLITEKTGKKVNKGILDITLYRDDLSLQRGRAIVRATEIDFNIDSMLVYIVDDVLFTGRTIRAAMDAIFDLGRPEIIKLAVLVDRGGRELPIQADCVGLHAEVMPGEVVSVHLSEIDKKDEIILESMKHEI